MNRTGTATAIVLPDQQDAFLQLQTAFRAEIAPSGPLQELVFQQLLHAAWTLHRCRAAEAALYASSPDPTQDPLLDPAAAPKLRLIEQTTRRAERSFQSALKQLRALQTEALYRAETASHATASPLIDTPATHRHLARNHAVRQQHELHALEAFLNTPPPPPPAAPGQTKPIAARAPKRAA